MNLEWLKKHKAAAIGGGVLALLVIYMLFRNSSGSSSSLGSAIAQQNQGQLQMAELNAQESAASTQTQAQLAATEYSTQAQEQEQQDQLAGQLVGTIVPGQEQTSIYNNEISAEEQAYGEQLGYAESLLPLEETAQGQIGKGGSLEGTGVDELALLLGEGSSAQFPVYGQASTSKGFGAGVQLPGGIGIGLFG